MLKTDHNPSQNSYSDKRKLPYFQYASIKIAFFLSLLYWIYLAFTTHMNIRFDSETFEQLGSIIYKRGWIAFFQEIPTKEPLYPFLISVAMRIADSFSISYQSVLVAFQVFLLFISQLFVLKFLESLRVHKYISTAVILYVGFSPGIVNSAFSLSSEILTYPFVMSIVLLCAISWQTIQSNQYSKILSLAFILAGLFLIITCMRAIYEYVFMIILVAYFMISLKFIFSQQKKYFFNAAAFLFVLWFLFHMLLMPYKLMNLKYNGYKATVIVGASAIYMHTIGRTRDITPRQLLSAAALIPGENVCFSFCSEEDCQFWVKDRYTSGLEKVKELQQQGIPNQKINSVLFKMSIEKILKKPFQYALLNAFEGTKMLFWESTKIGYVIYPPWLEKIYDKTILKNGLRLVITLFTVAGFFFLITFLFHNKKRLFNNSSNNLDVCILFPILIIISANILLYSFCMTATRYSLPFAPLYLIAIAFWLERILFRRSV